ncbi:DUF805 domain-containing protein [Rhodopirellula sp. MGV]|uniref:DUF805 domain-containing protein n=1 Tax=Rhodopirellula sp. MGV TaxID=2023130 RepID=UPI0013044453|nr:DUF805 domain-containing protein [Rhodopirellula sp. MGV]
MENAKTFRTEPHAVVAVQGYFDIVWILYSFRGRLSLGMAWIAVLLTIASWVLFLAITISASAVFPVAKGCSFLFPYIIAWNGLAVGAKRFHDLGLPGWFVLSGLIPGIGIPFLFYNIGVRKGKRAVNRYGTDPRLIWPLATFNDRATH